MSLDDLNWLIGELRSPNLRLLYFWQIIETYKGLNREYAQVARPYMRAHKHEILKHTLRDWQPIVDVIDTLPINYMAVDGHGVDTSRRDARWIWDKIRTAYREGLDVRLDLGLVYGVDTRLTLSARGDMATCDVLGGIYVAQWSIDEARGHARAITEAAQDARAAMRAEGGTVWTVWRAALCAAYEHTSADQWIHEMYEQDSYTQAVNDAEWEVICEVAAALHPDREYREYRDAEPGTEAWTEIQALCDALHGADVYAETEESCGDISAYLPNNAQLREILAQFAQEWHGSGADPDEIQSAIERAMDWVF